MPIYGMRWRLEDLKKQAIQKCDERFQSVVKRLHERLDAENLKDLSGLNHAMATLNLERESLQRISTWPWAADTLRRYLSSIALSVFIILLGRYIAGILGLRIQGLGPGPTGGRQVASPRPAATRLQIGCRWENTQ